MLYCVNASVRQLRVSQDVPEKETIIATCAQEDNTTMREVIESHFLSLVGCFFNQDNIKYTMHNLASHVKLRSPENLLSVAKMLLQDNICMAFSENGFAPFRRDPTIVFEYTKMTKPQIQMSQETLAYLTDVHAFMVSSKTNGVYMFVPEMQHAKFRVDPSLVIFATCVSVYESNPNREMLEFSSICNVILKRLTDAERIPRHCVLQGVKLSNAAITDFEEKKTQRH